MDMLARTVMDSNEYMEERDLVVEIRKENGF